MNDRVRSFALFASWCACLALGLVSAGVFGAGVARDTHFGQAALALELGETGPWRGIDFRVWDSGDYVLWLAILRRQPPFDPSDPAAGGEPPAPRFDGSLEARVLTPDGDVHAGWVYRGHAPEHPTTGGMIWTRLADVRLRDLPLRPWRLEARTVEAAPAFSDDPELSTRLLLRPRRPEVGMGGLINYVMIVPAGLFLCLAMALGLILTRLTGRQGPAWVSGISLALFIALFALG